MGEPGTTVHFRLGEDSWHLNHRCRSELDDQSGAAVRRGGLVVEVRVTDGGVVSKNVPDSLQTGT